MVMFSNCSTLHEFRCKWQLNSKIDQYDHLSGE